LKSNVVQLNDIRTKRRAAEHASFAGIQIPKTGPTEWISGLGSLSVYASSGRTRVIEQYLRAAQDTRLLFPTSFEDPLCTTGFYEDVPLYDVGNRLKNAGVSHPYDHVWSTGHTRAIADLILVQAIFKYKNTCPLIDTVIFSAKSRAKEILRELATPMSRLTRDDLFRLRTYLSIADISI